MQQRWTREGRYGTRQATGQGERSAGSSSHRTGTSLSPHLVPVEVEWVQPLPCAQARLGAHMLHSRFMRHLWGGKELAPEFVRRGGGRALGLRLRFWRSSKKKKKKALLRSTSLPLSPTSDRRSPMASMTHLPARRKQIPPPNIPEWAVPGKGN